ncbi:unnamed protein product [Cylicocyclus nassatus]|uniref:LisH domain-containing protein n=1 Tax=Cylicocyclus nassatus TaxID=53992 RepID=A0AA36GHW1_CYLNA|nr:unnamed protein product [Cylicocyclus nassatus]
MRICECHNMSFTSSELNYVVWRYLHESGFHHSAYVFGNESKLLDFTPPFMDLPSGSLVMLVQRGLYYTDAELRAKNDEFPAESGDDCKISLIEGAAHLNPNSNMIMEMMPHSSDAETSNEENNGTPASNGNTEATSTRKMIAGNGELPQHDPKMSIEMLREYFENKWKRSGPLESLPNLAPPTFKTADLNTANSD